MNVGDLVSMVRSFVRSQAPSLSMVGCLKLFCMILCFSKKQAELRIPYNFALLLSMLSSNNALVCRRRHQEPTTLNAIQFCTMVGHQSGFPLRFECAVRSVRRSLSRLRYRGSGFELGESGIIGWVARHISQSTTAP